MTDKLHCPYCGYELRLCDTFPSGSPQEHYECTNEKCKHGYEVMHKSTWKDLIDGKKALEALDWLNEYLTEDKVEENVAVSCQYLKAKITSITKTGGKNEVV